MKAVVNDPVLEEFVVRVRKALGPRLAAIHWFGSRARGEGSKDSDYDLLLEIENEPTERQRDLVADIAVDISAEHGVLLDIHYRSAEGMREAPDSFSPFVQSVLDEGILV